MLVRPGVQLLSSRISHLLSFLFVSAVLVIYLILFMFITYLTLSISTSLIVNVNHISNIISFASVVIQFCKLVAT